MTIDMSKCYQQIIHFENHIVCVYKQDLILNNLQGLKCHLKKPSTQMICQF